MYVQKIDYLKEEGKKKKQKNENKNKKEEAEVTNYKKSTNTRTYNNQLLALNQGYIWIALMMAPKRPSIAKSSTLSAFFTRNSCIEKRISRLDCEKF